MSKVLGVDLGTSGCKLAVVSSLGLVEATASCDLHPRSDPHGKVEIDPKEWYAALISALGHLRSKGVELGSVVTVGVTGQMQGTTLVDRDCNPVRNSILWNDTRSEAEATWFNEKYPGIDAVTGCQLSTGVTVSQVLWVMKHEPRSWERTFKVLHAPNYLIAKLTGELIADHNNLGLSGLNDFVANDWSAELLQVAGIERDKVPEVRQCFDVVGHISSQAASETGLAAGVPVVAAGGDSAAESFSLALAGSNRMKIRLGSAGDLNIVVPFASLDSGRLRGIRDVLPGYVVIGAHTRGCAASVKWARGVFFSELPAEDASYEAMDREAASVGAGSDGLLYFPYLSGEAAPYYTSTISAKFLGVRAGMRRGHFMRAVYEGVAYSLRDVIRSVKAFETAREYAVVGGGARSRLWTSVLADVLGHDVVVPESCDAAFGAALIAGEGTKEFDGVELARSSVARNVRIVPDPQRHATYDLGFEAYAEFAGR